MHCEVRRSEDDATITVGDTKSIEEGIGFRLTATVDNEGVAEFGATTRDAEGRYAPDMPFGTPVTFISTSLDFFEATGHHVSGIKETWGEGQSDLFTALERALGQTSDLHQAARRTPASAFYNELGFEVTDVTIEPTRWGRVATVTFSRKSE